MKSYNGYFEKMSISSKKPKIVDDGYMYLSMSGSYNEGYQVHFYRKLGWDSITTLFRTDVMSHAELLVWLAEEGNHRFHRNDLSIVESAQEGDK